MTDTGQALLAAVCDQPAEDLPRLVLADWLDERGEPGDAIRARFIRHQCRPETPLRSVPLTMLADLEPLVGPLPHTYGYNVTPRKGEAVVGYSRNGTDLEFVYRRGFLVQLTLPPAALDALPAVMERNPVELIRVEQARVKVGPPGVAPEWRAYIHIGDSGGYLDVAGADTRAELVAFLPAFIRNGLAWRAERPA
jgi:uncharacterized protein (TIGR02996 family)